MSVRFKLRRDTAANWASVNPVLLDGEPGWDKTNNRMKVGDGSTAWNSLPYESDASASSLFIQETTPSSSSPFLWLKPVGGGAVELWVEDGE